MSNETDGTVLAPYDFVVAVEGKSLKIKGRFDGNIRAKGGRWISFTRETGAPKFMITCSEFGPNDGPDDPDGLNPFEQDLPSTWVEHWRGKLDRTVKGAPLQIFKYTVLSEDPAIAPADPIIIVDH
jgi:hypothetical protein